MSTKKDKFSIKDKFYMELALDLAKSREGLTGPNPSVGCVIVKNDELISQKFILNEWQKFQSNNKPQNTNLIWSTLIYLKWKNKWFG